MKGPIVRRTSASAGNNAGPRASAEPPAGAPGADAGTAAPADPPPRVASGEKTPRYFPVERLTRAPGPIESLVEAAPEAPIEPPRLRRRLSWLTRIALGAGGLLVSLALGLAAQRLIEDLFATNPWLGWLGTGLLAIFALAIAALLIREYLSLRRLTVIDRLREKAAAVLETDVRAEAQAVLGELDRIYEARADLAAPRKALAADAALMFDGADMIRHAERTLLAPLDARAKAQIGASARRVAIVTAVSPRALIDISFVAYESIRLAGTIARLYGARPGLFGSVRLMGAVLAHLAVTGGLTYGDGILEQVMGHGLAERASSRLGEGLLNGLMTVRVGLAAMRVVRPLPFATQRQPIVVDYLSELANITKAAPKTP